MEITSNTKYGKLQVVIVSKDEVVFAAGKMWVEQGSDEDLFKINGVSYYLRFRYVRGEHGVWKLDHSTLDRSNGVKINDHSHSAWLKASDLCHEILTHIPMRDFERAQVEYLASRLARAYDEKLEAEDKVKLANVKHSELVHTLNAARILAGMTWDEIPNPRKGVSLDDALGAVMPDWG